MSKSVIETTKVEVRNGLSIFYQREPRRGCGYRHAGPDGYGLYLMSSGWSENCERLPWPLTVCPVCGAGIKFSRGFRWVVPVSLLVGDPPCVPAVKRHWHKSCPFCSPSADPAGLMWVGDMFYTPRSFRLEAEALGVSKRINALPLEFVVGDTWIFLAHIHAWYDLSAKTKLEIGSEVPEAKPGIFTAFRPMCLDIVINDAEHIPERAKALAEKWGPKARLVVVEKAEPQQAALLPDGGAAAQPE